MMLSASQISFDYGRVPVLADVSLDIAEGAVCGLVGPNGAGKSTLLRCLYGALRPRKGVVMFEDRDIAALSRKEIARRIGVVPQHGHPYFAVSVGHFVGMGRFAREPLLGGFSKLDQESVRRCLAEMDLDHLEQRSVAELSGGEFRRVLIAQALAQEPRLLLFDEPIQQLDLLHQLEVMEFARSFARRGGTATLVVLHDLGLAARYCDSLTLMHQGRVVMTGPPEQVLTEETIRSTWGVRAVVERNRATGTIQVTPLAPARDSAHGSQPNPEHT
ncbi:MAG TPA: ABC transporter ATP-binding protein [Planctomycetota bacterium]|nr:ABC transporter ATP-binding protein [Planctomycetota bacterium]